MDLQNIIKAAFATIPNAPITTDIVVFREATFWRPLFLNLYICLVFQRFWVKHWYQQAQTYQWENKFYRYEFLQLWLAYLPGLSCQYGCRNPIKWCHFCFQWLLVVYVPTNSFHVADKRFYTNTNRCTDRIYHADSDILWMLGWDSHRVVNGPCVFITHSTFWVGTIFKYICLKISCWKALVLCCYDEALSLRFQTRRS